MRLLRVTRPSLCVFLIAPFILPTALFGQFDDPPPPAAYAIRGATVVGTDGTRRTGLTVVVRNGLVEALAADVEVPPDAKILEGDSLWVYPGIVDAQGETEIAFPEREIDRADVKSWAPPRDVQGFLPRRRVVDHLTATGEDLSAQRKAGVVAAAVHPDGPVMPGRGTLMLFRVKAGTPADLVLRPVLGPVFSFEGASGVYPATRFGVSAFIRQRLEDARHHGRVRAAQAADPRGVEIPAWDPDLAVLRDAMDGTTPVFFEADAAEDIRAVLELAQTYGFRPVIVGGDEAWKVADRLRARDVPVLVSLDFPEPTRWKPDEETEEETEEAEEEEETPPSDTTQVAPPEQEEPERQQPEAQEELDAAAQREKDNLEALYANPARLADAGVVFALTSGGGSADIREAVRTVIEYGLPEDRALAALTATPATLLGVPYLSRIEPGLPATFVVTDGPLFSEDTRILYTLVAGEVEEGTRRRGGDEAPAVDVTGTWDLTMSAGGQRVTATLTVEQDGAAFSGSGQTDFGPFRVRDGTVSGSRIDFLVRFTIGGEVLEITYTGTVEGDEATGSGDGPQGPFRWRATRRPAGGVAR